MKHHEILETNEVNDRREALLEKNFESDVFITAAEADRESEEQRHRLLTERVVIGSTADTRKAGDNENDKGNAKLPFSM